MLLNYIKLSLRLLVRNPFFTFINVLGLSVGFAAFFILWQYSTSELASDQYHKDSEQIVRVGKYWRQTDDFKSWAQVTMGATLAFHAPMMANDFREIESYMRLVHQPQFTEEINGHSSRVIISVNKGGGRRELFEESRVAYADPNLFEFFSIPLIYGSKESVLKNTRSVVLSQTTALKYFGHRDPTGEFLMVNDTILLTVTGVFQDLPHNTHLAFDLVISILGIERKWPDLHWPPEASTYLKLTRETSPVDFGHTLNKRVGVYYSKYLGETPGLEVELFTQPLKDIAFSPPHYYDYLQLKSKPTLIMLKSVSVVILLMAWINYINLAASKMMKRMKEIGTRKVSGAFSSDFTIQFLVESGIINVLAISFAFTMMQLARGVAMLLFDIHISDFSSIPQETWIVFIVTIAIGLLIVALYPTFISISQNPNSLFAISKRPPGRRLMQSFLTTSQYILALILILWAFIVFLQLNYILNKDIGIQREQIVIVDLPTIDSHAGEADVNHLLNETLSVPGVQGATSSYSVVGDSKMGFLYMRRVGQSNFTGMYSNGGVDEGFIPFYGIRLIAGRNFLANEQSEAGIVSRHATRRLGYDNPEDILGEKLITQNEYGNFNTMHIVGVIEDYRVGPYLNSRGTDTESFTGNGICLTYKNGLESFYPQRMSVKLIMNNSLETLSEIKIKYDHTFPGNIFKWYFLSDHINKTYSNDKIARNQIALFTFLSIGISCLGLLGMISIRAEEKTKEIGIRKVLGASMKQIGMGLLEAIFRQLIVSIVIAIPVAYYLAGQYLDRYLEKINLQWWHFIVPIGFLLAIMFSTIATVLFKAARSNPVEALKYE